MKSNFKILLVEDLQSFRAAVQQLLGVYNDVDEAGDLKSAREAIQAKTFDVVILDKRLPDGNGIDLISEIKEVSPNTVVIILTSDTDFNLVKHCIARGADDYVIKSDNIIPDLLVRIPVAVSKAASNRHLENLDQQMKAAFRYEIIGKSHPTMKLREAVWSLKGSNAHVLITGESGTGKELIARRLNAIEDRGRSFVAVNCGAIPENLIESELFGHKKGSFTGALADRTGQFELAHNGDLFLDEIGEMPLAAQVKLLRVIQEGELVRVGDSRKISVNCRVIAATNQNLEDAVKASRFREDLYHPLNVVQIETTPLRGRMEDVPDLAKFFVLQIGGAKFGINDKAIWALADYDWPGNIRELRNAIERAVIQARRRKSTEILFEDINIHAPINDVKFRLRKLEASLPSGEADLTPEKYEEFLDSALRAFFRCGLEAVKGNADELANRIGIGRSTLFRKLKQLGVGEKVKPAAPSSEKTKLARPEHQTWSQ